MRSPVFSSGYFEQVGFNRVPLDKILEFVSELSHGIGTVWTVVGDDAVGSIGH
jgi:hypothetical protein